MAKKARQYRFADDLIAAIDRESKRTGRSRNEIVEGAIRTALGVGPPAGADVDDGQLEGDPRGAQAGGVAAAEPAPAAVDVSAERTLEQQVDARIRELTADGMHLAVARQVARREQREGRELA